MTPKYENIEFRARFATSEGFTVLLFHFALIEQSHTYHATAKYSTRYTLTSCLFPGLEMRSELAASSTPLAIMQSRSSRLYIQDTSAKVRPNTNATRRVRIIRPFVISHERRSPRSWWMLRWLGTNNLLMKRVHVADVELYSLSRSVFRDATTSRVCGVQISADDSWVFSYYGYRNPLWNGKRKQFYMFVIMHSCIYRTTICEILYAVNNILSSVQIVYNFQYLDIRYFNVKEDLSL